LTRNFPYTILGESVELSAAMEKGDAELHDIMQSFNLEFLEVNIKKQEK
jgi:hypothetical protein